VLEAAIRVKSAHLIKSYLKSRKKEKMWKLKTFFYINLHLKDCFRMEFTASEGELTPGEAMA